MDEITFVKQSGLRIDSLTFRPCIWEENSSSTQNFSTCMLVLLFLCGCAVIQYLAIIGMQNFSINRFTWAVSAHSSINIHLTRTFRICSPLYHLGLLLLISFLLSFRLSSFSPSLSLSLAISASLPSKVSGNYDAFSACSLFPPSGWFLLYQICETMFIKSMKMYPNGKMKIPINSIWWFSTVHKSNTKRFICVVYVCICPSSEKEGDGGLNHHQSIAAALCCGCLRRKNLDASPSHIQHR